MPVETVWLVRNEAERRYGFRLYQGGAVPGNEIRVVKTGDWDVEACAGTHLKSTGEIGFIKIIHSERVQDGVERLVYSIGIPALKAVQKNELLLWRVSEILQAPLEKLDKTVEKVVTELKETIMERRKLVKELAMTESMGIQSEFSAILTGGSKEINGVKLRLVDFKDSIDVDRMVKTANEIIKKDETTVVIFYGTDARSARIVVMAGKRALEKGVNGDEIVKEASAIIGGGGGGKPNFAQGGGTRIDKLQEAIKKAEVTLKKQLRNYTMRTGAV
jgi:alanyl-tRNA synthetase